MKTRKIVAGALLLGLSVGTLAHTHAASELESAQKLASMGVIKSGTTASDFGLSNTITRKEMMKIVMNLSGKNVPDTCNGTFGDVTNDWGCKYIETALSNGYIAANANFRPDDSISKAEAMKLILKARGIDKAYDTSSWQDDYIKTALDNWLIKSAYSDHNTAALRGWIFGIGAAEASDMMKEDSMMEKEGDAMMEKDGEAMMEDKEDEMMKEDETVDVMEKEEDVMEKAETGYAEYDPALLWSNDDVVLFFHAPWCPSCKAADKSIMETGVDDFLLLKTDYDSNTDLRKKYGVTYQHTFVQVDANGDLIKKWSGSNSVDAIKTKIQ